MTNAQSWLLLEYRDDLPEKLYRLGDNPDPNRLFDGTELAPYADQSPLLISVAENPSIAAGFRAQPLDWAGLQIDSAQPLSSVLQHLRQILFIGFDGSRKGVLRYSSPRTASYFFPALEGGDLPLWLGPIRRLSWYGATWRENADQQVHWYSQENPHADQWQAIAGQKSFVLDEGQAQALQRQQTEKFLFHWWQKQSSLSFVEASSYLAEGMASDFLSADSLSAYLEIRSAHRSTMPPITLPQGSDDARLNHLKISLERSATDKESHA